MKTRYSVIICFHCQMYVSREHYLLSSLLRTKFPNQSLQFSTNWMPTNFFPPITISIPLLCLASMWTTYTVLVSVWFYCDNSSSNIFSHWPLSMFCIILFPLISHLLHLSGPQLSFWIKTRFVEDSHSFWCFLSFKFPHSLPAVPVA
jgi:hypothetical protein